MTRTLCLAVFGLASLAAGPARAAPQPAVVVVPPAGDAALQDAIEKALSGSSARIRRFAVIKKAARPGRRVDDLPPDVLAAAFQKARMHYLSQEFSEMSLVLLEAERDHLADLVAQPARAAALNRMLGVALLSSADPVNRGTRSVERFRLALALAPDQLLDPALYPPATTAAFRKVRDELSTVPTYRVELTAPRGAQVVVDGRRYAFTRRQFALTGGVHYLQVVALGYVTKQRSIDVRGARRLAIQLDSAPQKELDVQLGRLLRDGHYDPRNPLHAAALLTLASAERLVDWKVGGGKVALGLGDAQGKLLRKMATPPDKLDDLWPRLLRGDVKPPAPIYKRWWFWTGIVLVAAAIAVPTAIVATQPPTINVVPRPAQ